VDPASLVTIAVESPTATHRESEGHDTELKALLPVGAGLVDQVTPPSRETPTLPSPLASWPTAMHSWLFGQSMLAKET